jgi:hypothetical protein
VFGAVRAYADQRQPVPVGVLAVEHLAAGDAEVLGQPALCADLVAVETDPLVTAYHPACQADLPVPVTHLAWHVGDLEPRQLKVW